MPFSNDYEGNLTNLVRADQGDGSTIYRKSFQEKKKVSACGGDIRNFFQQGGYGETNLCNLSLQLALLGKNLRH